MTRRFFLSGILAGLGLAATEAAAAETARDHYLGAAQAVQSPEWTGIRTSVVLKRGSKERTEVREVGEHADFRSGDHFRLRIQANTDGYAYLLVRVNDGGYRMLYPAKGADSGTNRLRAFEGRTIPGRARDWLAFDDKPAIEGLYFFLSAAPLKELESAKKSGNLSKSNFDKLMARNAATKFMVFDEQEEPGSGLVPATYYVERRTSERDFLVRPIELVHRPQQTGGAQ